MISQPQNLSIALLEKNGLLSQPSVSSDSNVPNDHPASVETSAGRPNDTNNSGQPASSEASDSAKASSDKPAGKVAGENTTTPQPAAAEVTPAPEPQTKEPAVEASP